MEDDASAPILYAVHPGPIPSKGDQDEHFIGFSKLCKLYNVPPAQCLDMSRPKNAVGRDITNLIHLRPDYHGDYTLPTS